MKQNLSRYKLVKVRLCSVFKNFKVFLYWSCFNTTKNEPLVDGCSSSIFDVFLRKPARIHTIELFFLRSERSERFKHPAKLGSSSPCVLFWKSIRHHANSSSGTLYKRLKIYSLYDIYYSLLYILTFIKLFKHRIDVEIDYMRLVS